MSKMTNHKSKSVIKWFEIVLKNHQFKSNFTSKSKDTVKEIWKFTISNQLISNRSQHILDAPRVSQLKVYESFGVQEVRKSVTQRDCEAQVVSVYRRDVSYNKFIGTNW